MSFATRCPACTTRFRVVADQLKISEGWVRCGQCGEVFDATQDLVSWSDSAHGPVHAEPHTEADARGVPPSATSANAPLAPPPEQLADAVPESSDAPAVDVLLDFPSDDRAHPLVDDTAWPEGVTTAGGPPAPAWTGARDDTADLSAPDQPLEPALALDEASWPAAAATSESSESPESPQPPAADDTPLWPEPVGFVRQAQRRAVWQRPGVRWALALASVCLVLALALQWVLHERDRIAALRPDLRPALVQLCAPLGCSVSPLRWIDALSIESTTLARRGNGRYALEVVLRNASMFELAMPALELSVTDVRDQLLVRRVILPAEMPIPADKVPPEGLTTLRLEVAIDATLGEALAGYRTLVFYP